MMKLIEIMVLWCANKAGFTISKYERDNVFFEMLTKFAELYFAARCTELSEPVACYTKTYGVQMLKNGFLADLPDNTLLYTQPSQEVTEEQIENLATNRKYWWGFNNDKFDWVNYSKDLLELANKPVVKG